MRAVWSCAARIWRRSAWGYVRRTRRRLATWPQHEREALRPGYRVALAAQIHSRPSRSMALKRSGPAAADVAIYIYIYIYIFGPGRSTPAKHPRLGHSMDFASAVTFSRVEQCPLIIFIFQSSALGGYRVVRAAQIHSRPGRRTTVKHSRLGHSLDSASAVTSCRVEQSPRIIFIFQAKRLARISCRPRRADSPTTRLQHPRSSLARQ